MSQVKEEGAKEERVALFTEKAKAVSSVVVEVKSIDEALAYAVGVCNKKSACQLLLSGCEQKLSTKADEVCDVATLSEKVISGVNLPEEVYQKLNAVGNENNFKVINSGLRDYLSGFDIAFSIADMGIAETGTVVCKSSNEDFRISTMVCEIHMVVLPKSKISTSSFDIEAELTKWMLDGPCYTAFISGPSRTADIERVLSIGVHGPLEMHIMLLED